MSDEADSQEYQNFASLLRRIVAVPRAEIQKRMADEKATKDWTKAKGQKQKRPRPIVSLDPGGRRSGTTIRDDETTPKLH